eukprot:maker-scaffold126_size328755-snap-gene-0.10 protein:Tk06899 transcript:maker-scaffold126_size328755-snap-gene-0.10-mRNA-1 annotation:"AGAP001552-PA"
MKTPTCETEFTPEWVLWVLKDNLREEDMKLEDIEVTELRVMKNEVQGILSQTFVVDVDFRHQGNEEIKSIFVKVPLHGEPMYRVVNEREKTMFQEVLPKLRKFLDDKCEGFFRLPMPELLHCHYDGRGEEDVFVMNNLLAESYYNFNTGKCLDEDHLKAVLDGLSYLHGTGLAFKQSVGGLPAVQEAIPGLEVQLQLHDLIHNGKMREHFRTLFRPYLCFMEDAQPKMAKQTQYMKRMHKHILSVIEQLENCGYERLITLAHGDAKPNNFMFRKIEIDIEDLECEGIESILIDWQGGFLGSVANDLMWALFPYVEKDKSFYLKAMEYYFDQLRNVLESFGYSYADLDLPTDFQGFASLLKKCLVLEFLIVTVIKPIMSLDNPEKLRQWHKETVKNTRRRFKKEVIRPELSEIGRNMKDSDLRHGADYFLMKLMERKSLVDTLWSGAKILGIGLALILSIYSVYACSQNRSLGGSDLEDISHLKSSFQDDEIRESIQLKMIKALNKSIRAVEENMTRLRVVIMFDCYRTTRLSQARVISYDGCFVDTTQGAMNSNTGIFTVKDPGVYQLSFTAKYVSSSKGRFGAWSDIYVNETVVADSQREYNGNEISTSESSTHTVMVIYPLIFGDVVKVKFNKDGSSYIHSDNDHDVHFTARRISDLPPSNK